MFANCYIRGVRVPCAALYLLCVLFIVLYGAWLRWAGRPDVLERRLVEQPAGLDGWGLAHVFFFGLLGFLYPRRHAQFLLVGVAWELIESLLGQTNLRCGGSRLQLIGDTDAAGRPTGKEDAYWYGRSSDVLMDVVGYTLGSALA